MVKKSETTMMKSKPATMASTKTSKTVTTSKPATKKPIIPKIEKASTGLKSKPIGGGYTGRMKNPTKK